MADAATGHILGNLLLFGRLLRRLGLDVHVGRMLDAIRVLEDIGLERKGDVRAALRTLLVHRKDDLPVFDEAFEVFWRQRKDSTSTMDLRSMGEQRRFRKPSAGPPPPGREPDDSAESAESPNPMKASTASTSLARSARGRCCGRATSPNSRRRRRCRRGS